MVTYNIIWKTDILLYIYVPNIFIGTSAEELYICKFNQ